MQRFDDYPVSLSTGIPGINIALFEISVGDLEIPISLDYHSSGFRPNDAPGIAGAGWSLSSPGHISRTIKGLVDEQASFDVRFTWTNNADYWDYQNKIVNKSIDTQHDIYSCQLPTGSAKFVYDVTGTQQYLPLPYKPWKIRRSTDNSSFTIIDELGRTYLFGGDDNYRERVNGTSSTGLDLGYTGWYLKSINLPSSDETINLSYKKLTVEVPSKTPAVQSTFFNAGCTQPDGSYGSGDNSSYTTKVLSEISFPTGKIVFQYNDAEYPDNYLKRVSLVDLNGNLQKAYELIQTKGYADKWFLQELKLLDKDQAKIGSYRFTYFDRSPNCSFATLGNAYSSIDHFGFFNGASNTTMMAPAQVPQFWLHASPLMKSGSANRSPNWNCAVTGVLKEITYPTGGTKSFQYEGNSVTVTSGGVTTQKPLSGLRIKRLTNTTGGQTLIREYTYASPKYINLSDEYFATGSVSKAATMDVAWECTQYTLASEPYVNIFLSTGAPVIYRSVTEYIGTIDVNEGRIVHEFNADMLGYESYFHNILRGAKIFNDGTNGMGVPEIKTSYFKKSETDTLRVIRNRYTFDQLKLLQGLLVFQQVLYPEGCVFPSCRQDANEFARATYSIIQLVERLKSKTITDFIGQQRVVTRTDFYYDGAILSQPSREEANGSDGRKTTSFISYPLDYGFTDGRTYLKNMREKNVVIKPIETIKMRGKNGNNFIVSATFNSYKPEGTGLLDTVYEADIAEPVLQTNFKVFTPSSGMDERYKERLQYSLYDTKGNILEIKTPDGMKTSYSYGQGLKKFPVTMTKNAVSAEVYYEDFEDGGNVGITQQDAKSGLKVKASGFVCPFIPPNNKNYTLSYWYRNGTSGQWTFFCAKNIPGNNFSSYKTLNQGNYIDEVRVHPSDAQMNSYSFDLFRGMTSSSDANGISTYYEYDPALRLKAIKNNDRNVLKTFEYHYSSGL
jgi:YD repeat-containing protein